MRSHFRFSLILLTLMVTMLLPTMPIRAQSTGDEGRPEQIILRPEATPQLAASSTYTSPATRTVRPFTYLLVRRDAHVPDGAVIEMNVRSSADGTTWTDWQSVTVNDDLWMPKDGPDIAWSNTVPVGGSAQFWQVRTNVLPNTNGDMPAIRQIDVHTVDTSTFVSGDDEAARQQSAAAAVSRPSVVSRTQWGSPDGQSSRVPPDYYPVNHMVVHHTADSNSLTGNEQSWADRVRAEWSFHTYSRGWGDVGYNYLIDPNGVIYEGRAGGDDAVAFHDTANYGSMGVVMIGTYATVMPTTASQNSLVKLLGWKASQKRIDPLGRSYYYGCARSTYCKPYNSGAIVANIAGHRQVTPGHTSCPGDNLLGILPTIRNRVQQLISGSEPTDNGDLQIDELESTFAKSDAGWRDAACGAGGHAYWTYTTDGAAENSATWRPTIPTSGRYRVYASIPQNCSLGIGASSQAVYRINYDGGSVNRTVDQNTANPWVDLGVYSFKAGTGGAVELYDTTGEPTSANRALFFDAVRWVSENSDTNIELTNVAYERTSLSAGELLRVSFTVRNNGSTSVEGQSPNIDLAANDGLNTSDNGYVYDQDECFLGDAAGTYPSFPKETNSFRVVLGWNGWDSTHSNTCQGSTGDYPWRWGINGTLAPGQQQIIVGYIRFRDARQFSLQAGLIQEYIGYAAQGVAPSTVTVSPEKLAPSVATFGVGSSAQARVYKLGTIPDNFLARTSNALSIPQGAYVGSFAWNGNRIDWTTGGPFSLSDNFVVEQTRAFSAPTSGTYTFQTTSDDGSWLWVDGKPVILNDGVHGESEVTGTIALDAGIHTLSFKYFERGGLAAAGYSMKAPGSSTFSTPPDPNSAVESVGSVYTAPIDISVTADDQGGTGMSKIRWSWDGNQWSESGGGLLRTGKLQAGSYRLRYQAIDSVGNTSPTYEMVFSINPNLAVKRTFLPLTMR